MELGSLHSSTGLQTTISDMLVWSPLDFFQSNFTLVSIECHDLVYCQRCMDSCHFSGSPRYGMIFFELLGKKKEVELDLVLSTWKLDCNCEDTTA